MQMDLPVFLNGFGKEAMDDMYCRVSRFIRGGKQVEK